MKVNLYSVQDVLTGFAQPFGMANTEVALRGYKDYLATDTHPEDKRLWIVGVFDDETAEIKVPKGYPKCIQGGGEKNGEETV